MPDGKPGTRRLLRRIAPLLGAGLLVYLVSTANTRALLANAKTIGWGILLVLALAGGAHLIKAWAWRLTLRDEARNVSLARALGLRLISEAIGQFGVFGMVLGETTRVSLLGSRVTTANAISSVTLDRTIFILTGAVVTMAGLAGAVAGLPLSHTVRLYAGVLGVVLLTLPLLGFVAMHRRWPVLSGVTRVTWLQRWTHKQQPLLEDTEKQMTGFYHQAPMSFFLVVLLNLMCHLLQVAEVYLIVRLLGIPVSFAGALVLEALTKLINVVGAINPGNVGTYEGGNMAIGHLYHLTAAQGLMVALCRRARALFWALIGGICLVWLARQKRNSGAGSGSEIAAAKRTEQTC